MSWAAHNALANGGVPNGHAVAHAIGSLYHITHGNACAMVLPTVVRHFALYAQKKIQKMAEIMGINVTGDAVANRNKPALTGTGDAETNYAQKGLYFSHVEHWYGIPSADRREDADRQRLQPVVTVTPSEHWNRKSDSHK